MSQLDNFDYKADFEKVNLGIAERFARFSKEFGITISPEALYAETAVLEKKLIDSFKLLIGMPYVEVYNREVLERIKKKCEEIDADETLKHKQKEEKKKLYEWAKDEHEANLWKCAADEYKHASDVNYYQTVISHLNTLVDGSQKS